MAYDIQHFASFWKSHNTFEQVSVTWVIRALQGFKPNWLLLGSLIDQLHQTSAFCLARIIQFHYLKHRPCKNNFQIQPLSFAFLLFVVSGNLVIKCVMCFFLVLFFRQTNPFSIENGRRVFYSLCVHVQNHEFVKFLSSKEFLWILEIALEDFHIYLRRIFLIKIN